MNETAAVDATCMPAGEPAAAAVCVEGVTKRFDREVVAVDGVSLSVAPGELLCLLGPSGSGKSTLLRLIGGFESPDAGRVFLLGDDVTDLPPARRRTNMVFQHHALFPHLNVYDNVAFGLRMRKVAEAEIRRRVSRVMDLVRLPGHESRKVDQLSGGQRQRVAIARAIVNDPAVLLLDEPMGALDLRLRLELQQELRRLQRSLGSPFIVVTHDQSEAMAMSDRIAVINGGRVEQIGPPDEIYNRPASLFVAQFIGHTNVLRGRVSRALAPGSYMVDVEGVAIPCHARAGLAPGTPITLSVREELVGLRGGGALDEGADVRLRGTVIERTFLGAQARYAVRVSPQLVVIAERPAAAAGVAVGSVIDLAWRASEVPAFPGSE